jgi:hypothetical protein
VSDRDRRPTLGDVVSAAALVLGLITAWLYVTGWTYAYRYFDAFRIPMLMAEQPREHLFVYQPVDEVGFRQSERVATMIAPSTA